MADFPLEVPCRSLEIESCDFAYRPDLISGPGQGVENLSGRACWKFGICGLNGFVRWGSGNCCQPSCDSGKWVGFEAALENAQRSDAPNILGPSSFLRRVCNQTVSKVTPPHKPIGRSQKPPLDSGWSSWKMETGKWKTAKVRSDSNALCTRVCCADAA